jgi:hypothetical protein
MKACSETILVENSLAKAHHCHNKSSGNLRTDYNQNLQFRLA